LKYPLYDKSYFIYKAGVLFPHVSTIPLGLGLSIVEVSRSHTTTHHTR